MRTAHFHSFCWNTPDRFVEPISFRFILRNSLAYRRKAKPALMAA
jgi:hypothetical protein